jgi:hypothetical protein
MGHGEKAGKERLFRIANFELRICEARQARKARKEVLSVVSSPLSVARKA